MADIMPFKAVIYDSEKVGDMNKVMAPPYDIISSKLQDDLYSRHANNFVKIDLNKTTPDDSSGDDRYSRSAALLNDWLASGVLKRDGRPAIYYYTQTYREKDGANRTRKGFIALTRLEEFGKGSVHPHEKTLSGPKADRLRLMQTTGANLSCIFSIYSEPQLGINKLLEDATAGVQPTIDVKDDDGIVNKVWRVDDPAVIAQTTRAMKGRALFIADGHHRYETALNYQKEMLAKTSNPTGREAFNYIMMYCSNMDDEGMTIWPTHRVVHSLVKLDINAFLERCKEHFNIMELPYNAGDEAAKRTEFKSQIEAAGKSNVAFGLHIRGINAYYVLALKAKDTMDKVFGTRIADVFKGLDVTVLHSLILSSILGITAEAQEKQTNLVYVKNSDEAIAATDKGNNQLAFILNPTRIGQVKEVALTGQVMPQKSTYFYPKLLSGLTINILDGEVSEVAARV